MKKLLTLAILLLTSGIAQAHESHSRIHNDYPETKINWSIGVTTDATKPNAPVTTLITSTDEVSVPLPGATVKVTVGGRQLARTPGEEEGLTEIRLLVIQFLDGSTIGAIALCRDQQVYDQSRAGLLLHNSGRLIYLFLQCDVVEK